MAIPYRNASLTATAALANGGPAVVTHIAVSNKDTGDRWFHIYDAAATSAVTVGTTTPIQSFQIPLGDGTDYGEFAMAFASPIKCSSGVVIAATTTPTGNTAPSTGLVVNMGYA